MRIILKFLYGRLFGLYICKGKNKKLKCLMYPAVCIISLTLATASHFLVDVNPKLGDNMKTLILFLELFHYSHFSYLYYTYIKHKLN